VRVLQVVGNVIVGGMERFVERLVERMPRTRFEVIAACPCDGPLPQRLQALGIEVVFTPMPEDPGWSAVQLLHALVCQRGIGVLHAHLPNAHLLAGLTGRLAGRPVLATIHGRQLALSDLEVHRAAGTHLSVVCRQSQLHALGLGADPARLACEPNGVDTARFRPRSGPRSAASSALREQLGLAPEVPVVGFVGRLSPEKGPEVFVRAALLLAGMQPQARAVIVGEGPMEAALRELVARHGLQQRVLFAGPSEDMPAVYDALDVMVCSSHSEAMPLAVMEAMASALPVVATRVGGLPELVAHGHTGWLVAPGDVQDVAARCAGLLADETLRRRLGQAARERAERCFELDQRLAAVMDRLESLATAAAAARERRLPALGGPLPVRG
jgi:glycosyltransferase involved in cell wall biosynthesis